MFHFRLTHTMQRLVSEGAYFPAAPDSGAIHSTNISLLLGGGYGFLTGQHGLALDNLVKVRPSAHPPFYCLMSIVRLPWLQLAEIY